MFSRSENLFADPLGTLVQELQNLAAVTPGLSARDLRSICEVTERRWASAIIKGHQPHESLPRLESYLLSAEARLASMASPLIPDARQVILGTALDSARVS